MLKSRTPTTLKETTSPFSLENTSFRSKPGEVVWFGYLGFLQDCTAWISPWTFESSVTVLFAWNQLSFRYFILWPIGVSCHLTLVMVWPQAPHPPLLSDAHLGFCRIPRHLTPGVLAGWSLEINGFGKCSRNHLTLEQKNAKGTLLHESDVELM